MFEGSCVAIVTPFKNGKVDEKCFEDLIDFHLQNNTSAILVAGTTGESATLTDDEKIQLTKIALKKAKGKIPIIAGSGTNSTNKTIELTKKMKEVGADACLLVTPYYNRPTQDGLYLHYKKIAEEAGIPLIIYNIPTRTGVNINPETIIKLARECPNIVGVKEASGSLDQVSQVIKELPNFNIWSGDDSLTLPMLSLGAKGVISVIANILPKEMDEMCKSFLRGETTKAMELHFKLYPLMKALFIETNPSPVKSAMEMLGLCSSEVRLPLSQMNPQNKEKLKQVMLSCGLKLKENPLNKWNTDAISIS